MFSAGAADIILRKAGLSLLDLVRDAAPPGSFCTDCGAAGRVVEVPVLAGWLGPGLPLPRAPDGLERYPFPRARLAGADRPAVARLARDVQMRDEFGEGDLALLDRSRARRLELRPDSLYLVNRHGEGRIRRVARQRDDLLVLRGARDGGPCEALPLGWSHLLDVVRARVAWIGRFLDPS